MYFPYNFGENSRMGANIKSDYDIVGNDHGDCKKGIEKPVLITQNPIMKGLVCKIKLVAKTNATLLITGESGTGKEVLACLAHYYSSRWKKPMVTVNCGAIPSELVESELFGHEKGAFTGAHVRKKGCFESAHESTLFLDEIGEMPKSTQVKLLRAIEFGSFRRVGGSEEVQVDISLISATNKILIDEVKAGNFREDLYYRLNVIELYVPPLRHRKEDIPLLVSFFITHFTNRYSLPEVEFSEECMNMFFEYDWPGNIRELRNTIERCVVLTEDALVNPDTIPAYIRKGENIFPTSVSSFTNKILQISIGTSLEEIEQKVIKQTLNSVNNNKTEAAKILGFSRKTLHNKLEKYATK